MKIGIVTTFRANNFGAALQAYSLVHTCNEFGADACIVNWRTPAFETLYQSPLLTWGETLRQLGRLRHFRRRLRNEILPQWALRREFARFWEKMPTSKPCRTAGELESLGRDFDGFIAGSDQIWRPSVTAPKGRPELFDRTYLLGFAGGRRKCAYAASMGKGSIEPDFLTGEFISAWKTFSLITMREREGAEFVSAQTGRDVRSALDPVLLQDAAFWRSVARPVHRTGRYVVLYNLATTPWLLKCAEDYAAENGCELVNIGIPALPASWIPGCSQAVGPDRFVDLIDHADAVFSSSFHACAFSAIFRKRIFLCLRRSGNAPNARFASFTDWTGVKGRVACSIPEADLLEYDFRNRDDDLFKVEQTESLGLLRQMLTGCES